MVSKTICLSLQKINEKFMWKSFGMPGGVSAIVGKDIFYDGRNIALPLSSPNYLPEADALIL